MTQKLSIPFTHFLYLSVNIIIIISSIIVIYIFDF